MPDDTPPPARPDRFVRSRPLRQVPRRTLVATGIVAVVTVAFAAGALASRGGGEPRVKVETVGSSKETTTSVAPAPTTAEPATTAPPAPEPVADTAPPVPEPTTKPTTKPTAPPAPPAATYTFEAPGAGTITVRLDGGVLTITAVQAYDGWTGETHKGSGTDHVKATFRRDDVVKWVKAYVKNGEVKSEHGEWTECSGAPAPTTATYELAGVGSVTVTWTGTAFTLDAVNTAEGWTVSGQDAPGDYVKVHFAPTEGVQSGDAGTWIKVKIHDCRITQFTG